MNTYNEQSKSTHINDFALAYQMRKKEWLENFNKYYGVKIQSKMPQKHKVKFRKTQSKTKTLRYTSI